MERESAALVVHANCSTPFWSLDAVDRVKARLGKHMAGFDPEWTVAFIVRTSGGRSNPDRDNGRWIPNYRVNRGLDIERLEFPPASKVPDRLQSLLRSYCGHPFVKHVGPAMYLDAPTRHSFPERHR